MTGKNIWRLLRPSGETAAIIDHDVVVGRGNTAQLRIDEVHVSRKHARLWVEDGDLLVEDLGSSNGTYLNGELLDMPTALAPGDKLRFDETEFRVDSRPRAGAGAPGPGPAPAAADDTADLSATVIIQRPLVTRPPEPAEPAPGQARQSGQRPAPVEPRKAKPAAAPANPAGDEDRDSPSERHWTESARPIEAPKRKRGPREDDTKSITAPTEDLFDLGADEFEAGDEAPEKE